MPDKVSFSLVQCSRRLRINVRSCLLIFLTASGVLPATSQTKAEEAVALVRVAEESLRNGRFDEARRALEQALTISPDNSRALFSLGQLHYTQGAFSQAEATLRRAVTLNSSDFATNLLLAASLLQQGKGEQALEPLEAAHRLEPENPDAAKLLAIEYMAQTRYGDAVQVLRQVSRATPTDEEVNLLLIEAYHRTGDSPNSLKLAEISVRQSPRSPRLNCWLGFQLNRIGRFDEAKTYLRKALELDPAYEPSYYVMGEVLLHEQDYQGAVKFLRIAISKNPNDVDSRVLLGRALVGLDRLAEARDELKKAAALKPDQPRPHLELAQIYMRLGEKAQAQKESEIHRRLRKRQIISEDNRLPDSLRSERPPEAR